MSRRCGLLGCLLLLSVAGCSGKAAFEERVREAVERQLAAYPQSTLRDLYKHFFQDRFGPGHLLSDTAAARRYLEEELASFRGDTVTRFLEPAGWEGNYCRVHLAVVQQGYVPLALFRDAFFRSVQGVEPPSLSRWCDEWRRIQAVIGRIAPGLPGFAADSAFLAARLAAGEWVGHHSPAFEAAYEPHYRIMSREIVEREIKPLLPPAGH